MKKKDLNTFIQEKLDGENGIPFKDEYWNQMNELLDANLPAAKVAAGVAKTTGLLKLVSISVVSLLLITVSVFSYFYFNSKTNLSKTPQGESLIIQENAESNAITTKPNLVQTEREKELEKPIASTHNTETFVAESKNDHKQTTNNETTSASLNTNISSLKTGNKTSKNKVEPSVAENEFSYTENTNTMEELPIEQMPINDNLETFSSKLPAFNFIDSRHPSFAIETPVLVLQAATLRNNPNKNGLVKELNISVFSGVNNQAKGNTIQSYTLPAQTNFTYGIAVEGTIKHISFRTGLALSSSSINLNTRYVNTIYTVDTTYKIINPNYGTTPSGKPIALVQKHLDTTDVTSNTYSKESSHRYQILSIPTTLQYKISLNRFTLLLEGGAIHHVRVAQQSNAPIQISSSETKTAFPTYSMQVCAGGGIRYSINLNWALGVNYLYCLNPNQTSLHLVNNTQQTMVTITRYLW